MEVREIVREMEVRKIVREVEVREIVREVEVREIVREGINRRRARARNFIIKWKADMRYMVFHKCVL